MKIIDDCRTLTRYDYLYITFIFLLLFLHIPHFAKSQSDTTITAKSLETIVVQATKIEKPWLKSANSSYTTTTDNKDQLAQNSLQEFLVQSPSIFALNANNKAQDLRISIRGFGSRAAFGVRGVKIIVDGIPETTADGQGQLDNLNLGIIERVEVLNNGSSALYGNASGGLINIRTTDEKTFQHRHQFVNLGLGLHSFGGQQYQLTLGKKINNTSLIIHANHHQGEGYREQSAFQSTNFNVRLVQALSKKSKIEAIVNYMNSPKADDPGGVNLTFFDSIPTAARAQNVQFKAGESINQFKASLRFQSAIGKRFNLNTYGFYSNRNFDGRLPFSFGGMIELKRNFFGHGTALTHSYKKNKFHWKTQLGYELAMQIDDRQRFENLDGEQGATTLYQDEQFTNVGMYWINDFTLQKWTINASLRYDFNDIEAKDKFLDNGDDSGSIQLNDFNYSLGLAYQLTKAQSLFVSYSTSFETPTLNELSNNPDGSGFNPNLKAQFAHHLETGIKGFFRQQSSFQVSAFYIASQNELLPYELENIPGRTFYRNIGNSKRLGVEFFIKHHLKPSLTVTTNWSFHQFTFSEYELDGNNLDGNTLPGLPNFQGNIQLDIQPFKNLKLNLHSQLIGKIFTNNNNTDYQDPKSILNFSIKYSIDKSKFKLSPYFGINNLFRTNYADNIRINAFGGRYYEAAPQQFIFGGVRVEL